MSQDAENVDRSGIVIRCDRHWLYEVRVDPESESESLRSQESSDSAALVPTVDKIPSFYLTVTSIFKTFNCQKQCVHWESYNVVMSVVSKVVKCKKSLITLNDFRYDTHYDIITFPFVIIISMCAFILRPALYRSFQNTK